MEPPVDGAEEAVLRALALVRVRSGWIGTPDEIGPVQHGRNRDG
jgi:hypothetical protein